MTDKHNKSRSQRSLPSTMNPQLAYILGEDPLDAALDGIEHRRFGNTAVLVGDAATRLAELPDGIIQCAVTSPPYFGLRSYSEDPAEIGKEQTPDEYVGNLLQVFSEVHRVLRGDGTCWVNLGDSYAGGGHGGHIDNKAAKGVKGPAYIRPSGMKPKDLIGIPWKAAFALRDILGFYLRQDIIWAKGISGQKTIEGQVEQAMKKHGVDEATVAAVLSDLGLYHGSAMPESVKDRCSKAHEYIFMLSKSAKYYFDGAAAKEAATENSGWAKQRAKGENTWKYNDTEDRIKQTGQRIESSTLGKAGLRNRRSVWALSPKGYKDAHFAVYSPELIEPMVLAGSKPGDIILDPFGGSGTTAGVAEKHGRYAILCELNPEYVELMPKRIQSIR